MDLAICTRPVLGETGPMKIFEMSTFKTLHHYIIRSRNYFGGVLPEKNIHNSSFNYFLFEFSKIMF